MSDKSQISLSSESTPEPEPEPIPKFPKAVFLVLGNELCERYSYYGMRSVLMFYMTKKLCLDESPAELIYHGFSMLNYFIPLFGGLLADMYLGKFHTIMYISFIYALGNIFLSLISIPQLLFKPKVPLMIIALVIISIGAGGIKPCVASFGGDQFVKGQEKMRDKFFSIFYMSFNVGAAMSMILSPMFRADVSCFGETDCYPLAFGFPALLMLISTIVFIAGKPLYKIYPARGTAVVDTVRCIWYALKSRQKSTEKKPHWLDYADGKYDPAYIQDVGNVLSVLLLFLPLPMFWALFEQQGSTWTMQAAKLDGRVTDKIEIHPDQINSMNAIMVVFFIPIFTFLLYPFLAKCNLLRTPLQKMCTGGFLAVLAFLFGGCVQLAVEAKLPQSPPPGMTEIMMINTMNCPIDVTFAFTTVTLKAYKFHTFGEVKHIKKLKGFLTLSNSCKKLMSERNQTAALEDFALEVKAEKAYSVAIAVSPDGIKIGPPSEQIRKRESSKASPYVRIVYTGKLPFENAILLLKQKGVPAGSSRCDKTEQFRNLYQQFLFDENSTFSNYAIVYPRIKSEICWANTTSVKCSPTPKISQKISMYKGGTFEYLLMPSNNNEMKLLKMATVNPDSIPILIQTPMYVLITAGEVMLSISGLTFAYSEAPATMKAVLQAAWLMTVALGNIIVIIIVEIRTAYYSDAKESSLFFLCAGLMAIDMTIFSLLAIRYKYKTK